MEKTVGSPLARSWTLFWARLLRQNLQLVSWVYGFLLIYPAPLNLFFLQQKERDSDNGAGGNSRSLKNDIESTKAPLHYVKLPSPVFKKGGRFFKDCPD